ncbi:hypothetical protein AX15_001410 [Amanita polypyramis BW_CC]|nr:hypothetical protein AX15_001410 [Amanita polypyramis BW_CC]
MSINECQQLSVDDYGLPHSLLASYFHLILTQPILPCYTDPFFCRSCPGGNPDVATYQYEVIGLFFTHFSGHHYMWLSPLFSCILLPSPHLPHGLSHLLWSLACLHDFQSQSGGLQCDPKHQHQISLGYISHVLG